VLNVVDTLPTPPIEWTFGGVGTLSKPQTNSKYCEIWNPNKQLVPHMPGACSYTQNIVTDADNGNWTFVIGKNGKLMEETFIQEIKVIKGKKNNF
jgi:hypothetical protein